jgi:hypothetical protein
MADPPGYFPGPRGRIAGTLPRGFLGSHTITLYIGVSSNLYLRVMLHYGEGTAGLRLQAPALP